MKIKHAYIDTNIIIYAVLHHPSYGDESACILRDAEDKRFEAYGSVLVASELIGALSKLNPETTAKAVRAYLSLNFKMIELSKTALLIASEINRVVNIRYNAIHAALMFLNNVDTVITNDLNDWLPISRNMGSISKALEMNGYSVGVKKVDAVDVESYGRWLASS